MERQTQLYVGLDVSLETTSICVVDDAGSPVRRGKAASTPEAIAAGVRERAPAAVRVGLETGQLSNWLTLGLRRLGLPLVCLDARHAEAALNLKLNKTDANDALGLAQVVRTGWDREVAVKSMDAHALRLLLVARAALTTQRQAVANNVRGLLKTFGIVIPRGAGVPFAARAPPSRRGRGRPPRATRRSPPSSSPCSSPGARCAKACWPSTARSSPAPRPTPRHGAS